MKRILIWGLRKFGLALGTYLATKAVDRYLAPKQVTRSNLKDYSKQHPAPEPWNPSGPRDHGDFHRNDQDLEAYHNLQSMPFVAIEIGEYGGTVFALTGPNAGYWVEGQPTHIAREEFDPKKHGFAVTEDEYTSLLTIAKYFRDILNATTGEEQQIGFARGALRRLDPFIERVRPKTQREVQNNLDNINTLLTHFHIQEGRRDLSPTERQWIKDALRRLKGELDDPDDGVGGVIVAPDARAVLEELKAYLEAQTDTAGSRRSREFFRNYVVALDMVLKQ